MEPKLKELQFELAWIKHDSLFLKRDNNKGEKVKSGRENTAKMPCAVMLQGKPKSPPKMFMLTHVCIYIKHAKNN